MSLQIVTDLLFGDGGKGLTVANLCGNSPWSKLVIRFSGGPNAGHTVIHNGKKHIFSSFCSGTLQNHDSYFTEDTTMYLPNLIREYNVLQSLGITPKLFLHPLVNVITPYDIAFHQLNETVNNHSSTGIGHGYTMQRNLTTPHKLYAIDFLNKNTFNAKMEQIEKYYYQKFNKELLNQHTTVIAVFNELLRSLKETFWNYFDNCLDFFQIKTLNELTNIYNDIIFENAQGIMLDMDHGIFPNVTYSNTASKNAIKYIEKFNLIKLYGEPEIYYVTRCYQTRHGNGWMSNENNVKLINNTEEINTYNKHQGEFRIGEFDYNLINNAIEIDNIYTSNIKNKNLIVGCLDQRPDFSLDVSQINKKIQIIYGNNSPETGNQFVIFPKLRQFITHF